MVWEIRGILPDHLPKIVDLDRVGKVRKREIKIVELRIRRSNKTVISSAGVGKRAADKIPGVDGKRRGLHRSRGRVLERSENTVVVNKGNVGGWVPKIIDSNKDTTRINIGELRGRSAGEVCRGEGA